MYGIYEKYPNDIFQMLENVKKNIYIIHHTN